MTEIIPAIMPKSFFELEQNVTRVKGIAPMIQIDMMDGKFVPEISWPFPGLDEEVKPFLSEERGLPFWQEENYEFDLMIKHPEEHIQKLVSFGPARIIVHEKSTSPEGITKVVTLCHELGIEIGIAFGSMAGIETVEQYLKDEATQADFVQVMGIERIGYQGGSFDPRAIALIEKIRTHYPTLPISVDGGVNFDSAPKLLTAGATRLVSGSAIFGSANTHGAIRAFQELR